MLPFLRGKEIELKCGGRLCGPKNDRLVFRVIEQSGIWEPHETEVIQQYLKPGNTFVDVGAHIGYFTVLASRIVGESGNVYSFEPFSANFKYLKKNIKLNKLHNVTAYKLGLWDSSTKRGILETDPHMARTTEGDNMEMIALDSLDLAPNIIKMDIEGAEPFALAGASKTIKKHHPILLLEFNPVAIMAAGGELSDYWSGLDGYDVFRIPGKIPVFSMKQLREMCPDHSIVDLFALPVEIPILSG